jgi:hypothetical protein
MFPSSLKRHATSASKQSVNSLSTITRLGRSSRARLSSQNTQTDLNAQMNCSINNFEQIDENISMLALNFYPSAENRSCIETAGDVRVDSSENSVKFEVTETVIVAKGSFALTGAKKRKNTFYL